MTTQIVAHRGNSSEAPENTLAAFEAAVHARADAVEFDVQATADGVPVVVHDEALGRTVAGEGRVAAIPLKALQALDAGAWYDPAFAGQRVPTLAEVLELLHSTALQFHIELKTSQEAYPGLAEATIRQVEVAGLAERVTLSSFNHYTLLAARHLAPGIPCAALTYAHLLEPWAYVRSHGLQALHVHWGAVTPHLVKSCKQYGMPLRVWTVNDEALARRLMAWGVDGIITDRPGALRRFLP